MTTELCWDYYNGFYRREVVRCRCIGVSKIERPKNGTIVTNNKVREVKLK